MSQAGFIGDRMGGVEVLEKVEMDMYLEKERSSIN